MAENNSFSLRMRQIPKPEYKLMKAMVKKYQLKDESELFSIALSQMYEVSLYKNGEGEVWITHVIDSFHTLHEKDRVYTLPQGSA